MKQNRRHCEIKDGIAQEFEPLIVRRAVAAMRERLNQQALILELVSEQSFQS